MRLNFLLPVLLAMFSFFYSARPILRLMETNTSTNTDDYASPQATVTLVAAADAYTRNGTYATTNYGTASTFIVKTTTSTGIGRASYLKFSLGSASSISGATLRIYGRCTEAGIIAKTGVYSITDDSWTESGINWNNAPAAGATALSSVDINDVNKYWDFDVTSFVQAQLAGDKTVSFLVKSPTNINRYLEFNSKENAKNRPQLILTTVPPTNQAPVLDPIGNQTGTTGQALTFTATANEPDAGQTKTYSLINEPSGASIDPATGAFSWTPATAGSYPFTVRVTDNGSPVMYDEELITVTVSDPPPPNQPPVLDAISDKTVVVGQALTFTATATEPDAGQTKTYSLNGEPAGATINATSGAFSWTPTASGSLSFMVRVTDNGSPALYDEKQVNVTVNDPPPNQAPVLGFIGNQSVTAEQNLTFTATATDPDSWQTKTYSLANSPSGASIDPVSGVFSWTPTAAEAGNVNVTVRVTDNGSSPLSDEETFIVTVNEAPPPNQAPVMSDITDKIVTVGQPLTFTADVTDPDAGQSLNFYLIDAPEGASIDESSGEFNWTPTTPGTFTFTVHVSDNATPPLSDEKQVTVKVNPVNQNPVLASIGDKTATVGQALTFTATANDDPSQTQTYTLIGAPNGAGINATSGAFTWTPNAAGSFQFTVRVTDDGSPALFDEELITVTVNSAASTTTLSAAADAYTRNGTYATTNYGTASTFIVKTTTTSGIARASYLKFSLGSASSISGATLRIYGRCTEAGIIAKTGVYSITDDSWTESGINWNNAPAAGATALSSVDINDVNKYWDFDVTSFVQAQLAGDKTVSFLVKSPTNINRYLEFNSKENAKNRPQLILTPVATTTNHAPILTAIGNKPATVGQALTFTATANEPDAGQTKTYSLINEPSGASIDPATGAFSWTPATAGSYPFTVRVTDNGSPVMYDEEQITVTVTGVITTKTFSNTQSIPIPNPGTVSVPITVSGLPSSIDTTAYGLQSLTVKVTHPTDGELTLRLQSPDGKIIYLFRKSPGVNINTTFDGVALKFIDNNEIAPYTGSFTSGYRPRQELSLLNNGQNPNGTWNLMVLDDSSSTSAGTVTGFSLTFGPSPAKPLLSSSTLPIIKIYTENGADILDDPKILADMYIINNGTGYNYANQTTYQFQGKIGIEIRGNSSATHPTIPKKQYGFETRDASGLNGVDTTFFGMPKQGDWILSAVLSDKTLMRNVIAYQIARNMGSWASRTKFCELIINDEYRGVFIFEEKIKRDKNRVNVEKMSTTDVTLPNVGGGYIFKLDDVDPGAVTWTTKLKPPYKPFQFVYPKPEDVVPAQKTYLESYVDSFEAALQGPNFKDPAIGFRKWSDDKSFMDFFIIGEVLKNADTYRFSTYFYKKRAGKLTAGPVWDFDRAIRNDANCKTWSDTGYIYRDVDGCSGRDVPWWWDRLLQDPKYRQDMICRYNTLRQTTLSLPYLYNLIDSAAAVLNAGGQQRNFIRWNVLGKYVENIPKPIPPTFAAEIDTVKNWLARRLAWMDNDLGVCPTSATARKTNVLEEEGNSISTIYPSPFKDHITVSLNLNKEQSVTVRLVDMNGKQVYQKTMSLLKGRQLVRLDFTGKQVASGLYMLQVNGSSFKSVKKVFKE